MVLRSRRSASCCPKPCRWEIVGSRPTAAHRSDCFPACVARRLGRSLALPTDCCADWKMALPAGAASPNPATVGYNPGSMIPQFDPIWAWPWVILPAAVSLVVVMPTYRQRIAHLPGGQRRLLLRCG